MTSVIDELLENNEDYAARFDEGDRPVPPARRLAIVTCMDSRLDVFAALGLGIGDAHVLRNAGGIATEDMVRSLVISQRLLDTRSIMVVQHTDCGMTSFSDEELGDRIEQEVGRRPPFPLESFADTDARVQESVRALRGSPFLLHTDDVRGFVYDVESGRVREVHTST